MLRVSRAGTGFGADQGLYSGLHAGVHISVAQLGGAALVERLGLKRLVPIAVRVPPVPAERPCAIASLSVVYMRSLPEKLCSWKLCVHYPICVSPGSVHFGHLPRRGITLPTLHLFHSC